MRAVKVDKREDAVFVNGNHFYGHSLARYQLRVAVLSEAVAKVVRKSLVKLIEIGSGQPQSGRGRLAGGSGLPRLAGHAAHALENPILDPVAQLVVFFFIWFDAFHEIFVAECLMKRHEGRLPLFAISFQPLAQRRVIIAIMTVNVCPALPRQNRQGQGRGAKRFAGAGRAVQDLVEGGR